MNLRLATEVTLIFELINKINFAVGATCSIYRVEVALWQMQRRQFNPVVSCRHRPLTAVLFSAVDLDL
jgi:hypothetical protein